MASADEITTLSIDIGTTTVVGARTTGGEGPSDIGNAEVVVRMPAIVGVDGGEVLTGEAAASLATTHPDQTVSQLIRRLGDSSPIILDGRAFSITELLGHVVADVATQAAIEPASTRLVLTHPAAWKDHRLTLLTSLGTTQGFATVEVVSDAVAATNPMTDMAPADVLVVDVGGGTVDVSVVAIAANATVVATQSLERLGGNDFDQAIFGHVMASVDNMIADLDRRDPAVREALLNLRANCTNAKERLSTDTQAQVAVSVPGLDTVVRITRAEFESVIRPQVEAIIALADRVVASAGIENIDRVIATGGSAAIPLIGETLSGHLGQSVAAGDDPATAAVLGATILPRPPATTDHEIQTSTTTSPERGTNMNDDKPTTADSSTIDPTAPGGTGAPPAPGTSGNKHAPIASPPSAAKKETSTGAKVAVGAAATAAAAAAAVVFGDDIADALGNDDGTDTSAQPADPTDDDSMDEFDSVTSEQEPVADVAGPQGVPLDSPIASRPAAHQDRTQTERDSDRSDDRPSPNRPQPSQTPDAPDVAPAAQAQGASAPGAQAGAPTVTPTAPPSAPGDAGDAQFEAARETLLDRLESFEAPAGTSPEDAAELRQELADAVAAFQPQPGQSTDAALAAMRDDFDQRIQDFVQDQKIDALVDEAERDNLADAAEAATTATPEAPPVDPAFVDPAATDPAAADPASVGIEVPDDAADPTLGDPVTSDPPAADPPATDAVAAGSDAPAALVDDFDTAAGRFEVAPDLIETMVTSTETLDPAPLDTADTIGVGLLDADVIRAAGPERSDIASGRESIALGDAGSVGGGPVDGPLVAGGRPLEPLIEVDLAPIAGLDTGQTESGDVDTADDGVGEPDSVIQRDDFVGDSVYDAVVDSPIDLIEVPAPDGILIGLDQPAPGDIDVDGLQVRAALPDDFVPPVLTEAEPFMADVPLVEESVSDFDIKGLEDEGNIPVDAVPDDMMD